MYTPVFACRLGSGTGIFTRALLAHPDWASSVKQLKALEPSEGMRDVFTKTVGNEHVSVSDGTFDITGVEDGWADLVVIAQVGHRTRCVHSGTNPLVNTGLSLVPRL